MEKDNKTKKQIDCRHCNCDKSKWDKINVCNCNCHGGKDKEATMCNNHRKKKA